MTAAAVSLADSLDDLGDAFTYGLSLYAVSRGAVAKARVALVKGGLILLAGAVASRAARSTARAQSGSSGSIR